MAQMNIKQIRGASQGSILFLGTNSIVSEDWDKIRWVDNKLILNGGIQISDGTQNNGWVLVSDGDGNASWTSSSNFVLNVGNGLSQTGSTIVLGGTLSQSTVINGDGYDFKIENFDTLSLTGSLIDIQLSKENGSLFIVDVGDTGSIDLYGGDFTIVATGSVDINSTNELTMAFATSSITDISGASYGLVYSDDYSGGFLDNSLVSKKYVDSKIGTSGPTGATGTPGMGSIGNNDVGVMYLKDNSIPTPITSINQRKVVAGTMSVWTLYNFIKDPSTNSLKYTGPGGRFHVVATFNFFEGNQKTCGFYVGHNIDDTTSLDPDGDRISESEIYINSSNPSSQPVGGAIQTVLDLQTDDRVFFIVQNKDAASDITVQFLKFTVTALTAEKGATGATGPGFNTILTPADYRLITATGTSTNSAVAQPNLTFDGNLLSVSGTVSSTGFRMTTSPTDGHVLTSDSSGNATWQPTGAVNGSGFINYVTRWIQSTTISATGSIYDTGSKVGIGITNSNYVLAVSGTTSVLNILGSGSNIMTVDGSSGRLFDVSDDFDYHLIVNDNSGQNVLKVSNDVDNNGGSSIYIGGDTTWNPKSLYVSREVVNISTTTQSVYRFFTQSWTGAYIDYLVGSGSNVRTGMMTVVFSSGSFATSSPLESSIGSTSDFKLGFTSSATYSELITWSTSGSFDLKAIIRAL
jgi:hypothetical protein